MARWFPRPPRGTGYAGQPTVSQRRLRSTGCAVLYLALVWALLRLCWAVWSFSRWQYVENRDPADVFRQVFHVAPPAGIQEIRASGWQPLDGNLWMYIRTEDIDGLLTTIGATKVRDKPDSFWLFEPATPDLKRCAASVDWESAHHVKEPEYYSKDANSGSWGWVVVVDRIHKRVFVGAAIS
jgi:hypothetical protein